MKDMLTPELAARLEAITGKARLQYGDEVRGEYAHDEMAIYGSRLPEAVCMVESTEEVSKIMALCYENNIPVTVRGAGTGLVGGCVPLQGGVLICTAGMNRILGYDMKNMVVHTQPGVLLKTWRQTP